jgi:hypothetical protein
LASNINEYQKILLGRKARQELKADKFIIICEPIFLDNVESSAPKNPIGFHGLLRDNFSFSIYR